MLKSLILCILGVFWIAGPFSICFSLAIDNENDSAVKELKKYYIHSDKIAKAMIIAAIIGFFPGVILGIICTNILNWVYRIIYRFCMKHFRKDDENEDI